MLHTVRSFVLFLALLCTTSLHADLDSLFNEDQDPTLFHHVNVITGNLNLYMQDAQVHTPTPLTIQRSYTSAGIHEHIQFSDLHGGWSLFPHTKLHIQLERYAKHPIFFIPQKNGSVIEYVYSHKDKKERDIEIYQPQCSLFQCSGKISARSNPSNNILRVDFKRGEATLCFPDGGFASYKGKLKNFKDFSIQYLYLEREVLPNKHFIQYTFNKKDHLKTISYRSPKDTLFALIEISREQKNPSIFTLKTSDHTEIKYESTLYKAANLLHKVSGETLPQETIHYEKRPGLKKARVSGIEREGITLFNVTYLPPSDPYEDRVQSIQVPLGPQNAPVSVASFSYHPHHTEVRDVHNLLTRYHHSDDHLTEIESFDESDTLSSVIKFIWEGARLKAKVKLDHNRTPLFSKTFIYDPQGNVTEELFWGNLTGQAPGPYTLNPDGTLTGAESYYKRFAYDPKFNLPTVEEEEGGLTHHYTYKPHTDLLTSKLTYYKGHLLKRTCNTYDHNHLLIEEVIDDGIENFTERHIRRYTYPRDRALPDSTSELYVDPITKKEILLKRSTLTYDHHNRPTTQTLFDANNKQRYTLHTTYDAQGNITSQTNPIGQKSTYTYDSLGKLLTSSEIGKPTQSYTYDQAGNPTSCTEDNTKITYTTYDLKGRPLTITDPQGNTTRQRYNAFGHCLETHLPQTDETPIIYFTYDVHGNIASATNPEGATTHTHYNILRKPICITHPDGTQTTHTYNTNGTLATTTHPDGTTVQYTYDPFHRKTSEKTLSPQKELLKEESWEYTPFRQITHTDPLGLTTHTTYDGAGRKIREHALEREKKYSYDPLGFLETTSTPPLTHIETHDPLGRVIAQWDQTPQGAIENHMTFTYDQNNRKHQAQRQTAQGIAIDTFTHDTTGRLLSHTDPLNNTTTIHYNENHSNAHDQHVLQKTTTDPLGNCTVETYDVLNHLAAQEKQNPAGQTVAFETYTYDLAGNKTSRTTTLYHDTTPIKTLTVTWTYDTSGRITSETEADQKTTHYTYDTRGRLSQKTLPSGTTLTYTYDGIGRLLSQISSDNTIHYQYNYHLGENPTHLYDVIHDLLLTRTYNPFGELIHETTPHTLHTTWTYDTSGRCTQLQLPAQAHITYTYTGPHLTTATLQTPTHACQHHYTHFDPNGHVTQEQLINSLGRLTTTHDILECPSTQTSPFHTHIITYGPSGLVTYTHNTLQGDKSYTYDPLNQLLTAGPHTYHFDSCGNPTDAQTNTCNQILTTPSITLTYDPNGNPLTRQTTTQTTYTYDALGRLTTLTTPTTHTTFTYDPLSRLIQTTTPTQTEIYLYDQDSDIGTLNADHTLKNLKLLGLGIKGDIGATVAILANNTLYAPLHDTQGNIIALIAPTGTLQETYHFDPFGYETPTPSINPWHYSSKRTLHDLIYFGLRFYDPTLARFLTPDPAGFTDSPNLYLYTLNSPLNRLDLFGLTSEPFNLHQMEIIVPVITTPSFEPFVQGTAQTPFSSTDILVLAKNLHQLPYTPEELLAGTFNLCNHLSELLPQTDRTIGLITFQNGINTDLPALKANSKSIIDLIPEGTLFLAIHLPTLGFFRDLNRTGNERLHIESRAIAHDRQIYTNLSTILKKTNPKALWLHLAHSAGALRYTRAFEGMTPPQQESLQSHLLLNTFGGADSAPLHYALSAINYYSQSDHFTLHFAKPFLKDPNYDIKLLPCTAPRSAWTAHLADHNFLSPTYQTAINNRIDALRTDVGFYDGNIR